MEGLFSIIANQGMPEQKQVYPFYKCFIVSDNSPMYLEIKVQRFLKGEINYFVVY